MLIVFANSKGGVGKSTLAVHLATWLAGRGRNVGLLDADKQRSSSAWIAEAEPGITISVATTPKTLAKEARRLCRSHDFVVADAPGRLEGESRMLLILAGLVIVPIMPSILDLRSLKETAETICYAQRINQGKPDALVVLNGIDERTAISRELACATANLGLKVAKTSIRRLAAFPDAAQQGSVVTRMGYRARKARQDINQLFVEVMTDKLAFLKNSKKSNKRRRAVHG